MCDWLFSSSGRVSVCVIDRSFVVQQIPSSNLFMVVVDNQCDCSMVEQITMDPVEIIYILHPGGPGGSGRGGVRET